MIDGQTMIGNNLVLRPHRPANAKRQALGERIILYGVRPFAVDHRPGAETSIGRKLLCAQNHHSWNSGQTKHRENARSPGKSSQVQAKIFSLCDTKNLQPSTFNVQPKPADHQTINHQKMPIIKPDQSASECTNEALGLPVAATQWLPGIGEVRGMKLGL